MIFTLFILILNLTLTVLICGTKKCLLLVTVFIYFTFVFLLFCSGGCWRGFCVWYGFIWNLQIVFCVCTPQDVPGGGWGWWKWWKWWKWWFFFLSCPPLTGGHCHRGGQPLSPEVHLPSPLVPGVWVPGRGTPGIAVPPSLPLSAEFAFLFIHSV